MRIMTEEQWSPASTSAGIFATWFHDIGRFQQYETYQTFSDRHSIDHGDLSAEILETEHLLDGENPFDVKQIIEAVRVHNKKLIPEDHTGDQLQLSCLVRDADKLDILNLLRLATESGELFKNPDIFWNLPIKQPVSAPVRRSILQREPIDYSLITCLADFIMIQVGWIVSDLKFSASKRIVKERKELEFRHQLLLQITNDNSINSIFSQLIIN